MFGTKTRKRKFKYKVVLRGTRISRHFTKKAANAKARSIIGASVKEIYPIRRRRTYKRRY